jgi:hypothetical protein
MVIGVALVLIEPPGLRNLIDGQGGNGESETARTQIFVQGEATALVKDRLLRSLSPLFRQAAEVSVPPTSSATGCVYSMSLLALEGLTEQQEIPGRWLVTSEERPVLQWRVYEGSLIVEPLGRETRAIDYDLQCR